MKAIPSKTAKTNNDGGHPRIETAVTSIEDLSKIFTKTILRDEDFGRQYSIEGLAYASLQPKVKESIVKNETLLKKLLGTLSDAQPRSPTAYGALSIFLNLTQYLPAMTEEQKKMTQLKAYANAGGKVQGPDPLNSDEAVAKRCKAVFDAGITPVLVTQSKRGSPAALGLSASIIFAISATRPLRGPLAQQGAVKLLLTSWLALPETDQVARRTAAHALARILISINPAHVFGGNRTNPLEVAIRPLISIIPPDAASDTRDLLPTFETLMALTNLASMDDETTRPFIIQAAWGHIEEQLLSSNALVSKAAVELICNLMQSAEGIALYADGSFKAKNRLHILLALADAEDEGTRSAAGGALASLTGFDGVVRAITERERGVNMVLGLCVDDNEDLRHRGVVTILNMVSAEGEAGDLAKNKIKQEGGVEVLKECLKKSRRPEVLQVTVQALKPLLDEKQ